MYVPFYIFNIDGKIQKTLLHNQKRRQAETGGVVYGRITRQIHYNLTT